MTYNQVPTLFLTKLSRSFQYRENVSPGRSRSPPMVKYKDKQRLLTAHIECNPIHVVLHKHIVRNAKYIEIYLITVFHASATHSLL